jgi:hypothetical protein
VFFIAQKAKDYAREQLGNIYCSYLRDEEEVANKIYGTTKTLDVSDKFK